LLFCKPITVVADIRIVLVETTHPGNIGAAARAMKNMGLRRLYLVAPHRFPCADATARAAGADDLLARAVTCASLAEAIGDCRIVIGASARSRAIAWPEMDARTCAERVTAEADNVEAAIVFGREHSGLSNAELDLCQFVLKIPCNPGFGSLNVAAAVQIVSYELLMARGRREAMASRSNPPLATSRQVESFYEHLHQTLLEIGFLAPGRGGSIMRRLRRLFSRTQLETREIDILRGMLSAAQGKKGARRHGQSCSSSRKLSHESHV
jgi:tRNA (cytidine32/uridine32-2'-O)-methyltransferase